MTRYALEGPKRTCRSLMMAQDAQTGERAGRLAPEGADGPSATPMMSQYLEIKAANPGLLLFYRMGDFYELFFEDAETASRALGIALTRRGKHRGEDIPMCGVPVRSAEDYLHRLIRLGHRVAVCEQTEEPADAKRRGSKALIKRQIVRLVTPGTLTEETLLEPARPNYLLALARTKTAGEFALAWADISTGEFFIGTVLFAQLLGEIARIDPSELLLPEPLLADPAFGQALKQLQASLTPFPLSRFDGANGEARLKSYFAVAALEGYGAFTPAELGVAGALLDYILLTQLGKCPSFTPPRRQLAQEIMSIDAATRANLELISTLSGDRRGSLLAAIDRTVTGAGARLLARRLAAPLTGVAAINARLDAVSFFVDEGDLRHAVRSKLAGLPEISRSLGRLSLDRGGPRDLVGIGRGLAVAGEIAALLRTHQGLAGPPPALASLAASASSTLLSELRMLIAEALA